MSALRAARWVCWLACLQLAIVSLTFHGALAKEDLSGAADAVEDGGARGGGSAPGRRSATSRRFGSQPTTEMFKQRMEARKSKLQGTRGLIRKRRHENVGSDNPADVQPDTGMRRMLEETLEAEDLGMESIKAAFSNLPSFSKASRGGSRVGEQGMQSRIRRSSTLSRIAAMGSTKAAMRVDAKVRGRGAAGRRNKGEGFRINPNTGSYINEKKPSQKEAVARARRIAKQNPALKVDYGDGVDPPHAPKDYTEMPAVMAARRAKTIQERGGANAPVPHPPPEPKPEKAAKKSPPPELKIKHPPQ